MALRPRIVSDGVRVVKMPQTRGRVGNRQGALGDAHEPHSRALTDV
jgi:hypothetical protein